jgi:hypothetical protein
MLSRCVRQLWWILAMLVMAQALYGADLHFKKNISVGGTSVSSSETWVKGARERTVTSSPTGNLVSVRQCDMKRTLTISDQTRTYLAVTDPEDDSAAKAATLFTGAPTAPANSGGTITQSVTSTDTGERKQISGYSARHLKTTVLVEPSANACSQLSQKYEIDGWYADLAKEQASCRQSLPAIPQSDKCSDRLVVRHKGTAKPGYPLLESINFSNDDGTVTKIDVVTSEITKQMLGAELFDVPAGYREVKSAAELYNVPQSTPLQVPQPVPQVADSASPAQPQVSKSSFPSAGASQAMGMAAGFAGQNAMMAQAQQMATAEGLGAQFQSGGMPGAPGQQGVVPGAAVPLPQALGPKAPGKIRIGIAPAQAQMGQGNNAQADYGTPIRNAIIFVMNGPAVEIAPLDARIPIQVQAEAQQKQCDYILLAGVTVKHGGGGGFGKFNEGCRSDEQRDADGSPRPDTRPGRRHRLSGGPGQRRD